MVGPFENGRSGSPGAAALAGAPQEPAATPLAGALPKPNPRKIAPGSPAQAPGEAQAPKIPNTLPAEGPKPPAEGQWQTFASDRRMALLLCAVRNAEAAALNDPQLKPNAYTVNLWAPALGSAVRSVPTGEAATGALGWVVSRWVTLTIAGVILFVIIVPAAMSLRRQRAQPREPEDVDAGEPAPRFDTGMKFAGDGRHL